MADWLEGELCTLALCWRIDRRDGVTLGFTSHDRDLVQGGLVYRAAPGMTPSAIMASEGLDVATLDVAGALSADAIRADDLAAGRWDGARVRICAVDWSDPAAAPVPLARGELGEVELAANGFSAELRGPAALLERPVVEATSPDCRAELGDARCRVDMAGRRKMARVTAMVDAVTVALDTAEPRANAYGYGRLRWIDGGNSGLTSAVLRSAGTQLVLREPPVAASAAGTLVELIEGCDKLFETCRDVFSNGDNFRGEPHLPGMDLLTRYPGA